MDEQEAIRFRWFGIIEKAITKFLVKQNTEFAEKFTKDWEQYKDIITRIINRDTSKAEDILKTLYHGLMRDIGTITFTQLIGTTEGFNPNGTGILQLINNTARTQVEKINETTEKIVEKISKKAVESGMTVEETSKEIKKSIVGMSKTRATRIARLETIGGSNMASLASAEQVSGKVKKYWINTKDTRTRKTHRKAGIQYNKNNAIELEETFKVGKTKLRYPADKNGSAEEIMNCRCTIGYVRKE